MAVVTVKLVIESEPEIGGLIFYAWSLQQHTCDTMTKPHSVADLNMLYTKLPYNLVTEYL